MWPASTLAVAWSTYGTINATTVSPRPAYIAPMADRLRYVVVITLRSFEVKRLPGGWRNQVVAPRSRQVGMSFHQHARSGPGAGSSPEGVLEVEASAAASGAEVPLLGARDWQRCAKGC